MRYLQAMARELVDVTRLAHPAGDPNAKIECNGTYESASCWRASCECDTVSSCNTMFTWCVTIGAKESGLSCSAGAKSGCP